ncbi:bifunctional 2-polyprenyl-6-hydroxyphenol methylase/3-demethylubiquinol 3-O-methyltransferase UbiG [Methyloligella sp. 2.7D]|uniref:bifunctional 2-polyprenyl-6-hydroxyphenol methylase/3-demethylubiquinol 3-O-methyltransferase UbiG n=1 Tax=unclassified Methyloligella TaxID=2625955 RepID=UPI00157D6DC5|nr:bifunctional 2-polyprenyl-6-hydroxyphenol methylase/3-demethylubiquinol 3-O-methyltransferase UbiG [Methyloligella sp. GL2]QKP78694.1 bifunctional 2-polyprenyl-6-hydroxyphenol methylase/3-demethylubiquinol 3-O-methyltransferase UbiG [Methyloligella sp. GL2]
MQQPETANLDPEEVRRFAEIADSWWDLNGPFRPLHQINPLRLTYIRDRLTEAFKRDASQGGSLEGLSILDIGCGGGLVCEPLRRLGASVTGIDPAEETIQVAKAHAAGAGLDIDYRATTAETLAERGEQFDAVLALEVVEHVHDVPAFIATLSTLVKPGGVMIASTINRTLKSYALAIVAAEYLLRWVPAGTHQWDRFVTTGELNAAFRAANLKPQDVTGMVYNPLADQWRLSSDSDVNYFAAAAKPA